MNEAAAVVIILALVAGAYLLMWRGWRRRTRHAPIPHLPDALPPAESRHGSVESLYLGTTIAGDWSDRVIAQTLGRRGAASVRVTTAGVAVEREPEPEIAIAAEALHGARIDRAGGGRAVLHDEYLILTWALGDVLLDTAVRPDRHDDLEALHAAAAGLVRQGASS